MSIPLAAPRRIFYGWFIVAAVFVTTTTTSGLAFYNLSILLAAFAPTNDFRRTRHRHHYIRTGLPEPNAQVTLGVLKFLKVVLAHEAQQLFDLPEIRARERRTSTRLYRLFRFHAFFRVQ
jgi:hypothetical protein